MRACQADQAGPVTTTPGQEYDVGFVGGRLSLGDASFWSGRREVPRGGDGGYELSFSATDVVVLAGRAVVVLSDPANSDALRHEAVRKPSVEARVALRAAQVRAA